MKFTVQKEDFIKALQLVQPIVPTHTTQPILYNVLVKAEKDRITLLATDLSVSMQCSMPGSVAKTGAGTFNARTLFSIARELPQDKAEFRIEDKNNAMVECGQLLYKLVGLSSDDFPALPSFKSAHTFTVEQSFLRDMLQKTAYAASNDESRMILNGVLMSVKGQKMVVVATDGRRLALIEKETELANDKTIEFVIPTKTISELVKVLRDTGQVKINLTQTMASFEMDSCTIITKLIEGAYPNYQQVIPNQCDERVSVDRETLLGAMRRATIMCNERTPSVKLTIAKNAIQVQAADNDLGEANEQVPVKYSGKAISMSFNPNYLMDPLKTLSSDEVAIEFTDELSPAVVKSNIPFVYVLMPLRTS